ncbi:MAG: phosphatidylserine decarboxylase family protein [Flavobacteriia bacterium]|nr:MAG: phosphatidylserine decarboxylase family protein [Flavobacteriia bacterium]
MFHKEGHKIIVISSLILVVIILLTEKLIDNFWFEKFIMIAFLILYLLILYFFRNPKRVTNFQEEGIIAPADGKVVVVEEVVEKEFFKDKRRQISIFMSPLNIHVTRYPLGGKVIYSKYHPGKYLVAWHPKSSEENERTSIVVENEKLGKIMYRQVAGAIARRIVNYARIGQKVEQGTDAGFIKFGSRIDIYIPLDMKVHVKLNEKTVGGKTIIASL